MTPSAARRDWFVQSISADDSLHIAGAATTFPFLRSLLAEASGDVAVVDLQLERESTIARDWLLELLDLVAIVALSFERDPLIFNRMLQNGVGGILRNDASSDQIIHAIKSVASGLMVFDSAMLHRPDEEPVAEALTPRENEVLRLLADGLGNKEIAARLNISEHTIKFHIRSILGKLGASSRTEAVSRGLRSGLIEL